MSITPIDVYKSKAVMCFEKTCINILVGINTPTGKFDLINVKTNELGYGGDVIKFFESNNDVYAIHRIWNEKQQQNRTYRISSNNISDRFITSGCINVDDNTYSKLLNYRYLIIHP